MSATLSPFDLELLHGRNFAYVAVNRPNGPPHVTITWIDEADGHVLVNTAVGRVKDRLLRRDPRVSVSVHDGADGYRWTRIEGTVVEFATGQEAGRHIDALSRKYHDGEPWTQQPGQIRLLLRIRPDRIYREE